MDQPSTSLMQSFSIIDGPLRFSAAGCSSRGTGRENNEDAILIAEDLSLCMVADGVGGSRGGEIASHAAIEEVLLQTLRWPRTGTDEQFKARIDDALHAASNMIERMSQNMSEMWGSGTTLVLTFRMHDHLFVVSVGDSRAYRLRGNSFQQLTVDDSWVEMLVRVGSITREQARTHPKRNIVLSVLGSKDFGHETPNVGVMELKPGDRFVLCTDGLHDALTDDEVREILDDDKPLESIVSHLVLSAVGKGSQDDVSVIVMEVSNVVRTEEGLLQRSVNRIRDLFGHPASHTAPASN